jgi:hypothetical protein
MIFLEAEGPGEPAAAGFRFLEMHLHPTEQLTGRLHVERGLLMAVTVQQGGAVSGGLQARVQAFSSSRIFYDL